MYQINYNNAEMVSEITQLINKSKSSVGRAVSKNIASDMVDLIPNNWFKPTKSELNSDGSVNLDVYTEHHRVLDLCCNSGILLYHFFKRFRYVLQDYVIETFGGVDNQLCEYILKNLLYGFCADVKLCKLIRGALYNNQDVYGNIYNISFLDGVYNDCDMTKILDDKVLLYQGKENGLVEMRFDVVCGNPPYNNDIYLDFVMLGHRLARTYDLWITPAKFLLYTDDSNKSFRQSIVPYVYEFVHYQNEADVFKIAMPCGICYYGVDKSEHNDKYVTNKSDVIDLFNYKRILVKDFKASEPLLTLGRDIVRKLDLSNILSNNVIVDGKFKVFTNKTLRGFFLGGTDQHIYTMTPVLNPVKLYPYSDLLVHSRVIFSSDSEDECLSFMSYISTKFVRFLILLSSTGYSFGSEFIYTFVPKPKAFDHIFTDDELYAEYNLSATEIGLIDSVIKERKFHEI